MQQPGTRGGAKGGLPGGWRLGPATLDDLETLVRFNRAIARETEGLELDEATVRSGLHAMLTDPARGVYLVVRDEHGVPAGQISITTEWSDWRNGWFWWIQSVYVRPDARGRGLYGALHREVEARARARGDVVGLRLYVAHDNRVAQSVYDAMGMAPAHYRMFERTFGRPAS